MLNIPFFKTAISSVDAKKAIEAIEEEQEIIFNEIKALRSNLADCVDNDIEWTRANDNISKLTKQADRLALARTKRQKEFDQCKCKEEKEFANSLVPRAINFSKSTAKLFKSAPYHLKSHIQHEICLDFISQVTEINALNGNNVQIDTPLDILTGSGGFHPDFFSNIRIADVKTGKPLWPTVDPIRFANTSSVNAYALPGAPWSEKHQQISDKVIAQMEADNLLFEIPVPDYTPLSEDEIEDIRADIMNKEGFCRGKTQRELDDHINKLAQKQNNKRKSEAKAAVGFNARGNILKPRYRYL